MPNWTYNKITCKKELADRLLTKENDEYILGFNKLIPMPPTLKLIAGSTENRSVACYYHSLDTLGKREVKQILEDAKLSFYGDYYNKYESDIDSFKHNPEKLKETIEDYVPDSDFTEVYKKFDNINDLGKQYVENIKEHGFAQWYDWCNAKWGTKWNVFDDVDVEYNEEIDEYEISFNTAWSIPYGIFEKFFDLCKNGELNWLYEDEDYNGTHILTKENDEVVDTVEYYEIEEDEEEEMEI